MSGSNTLAVAPAFVFVGTGVGASAGCQCWECHHPLHILADAALKEPKMDQKLGSPSRPPTMRRRTTTSHTEKTGCGVVNVGVKRDAEEAQLDGEDEEGSRPTALPPFQRIYLRALNSVAEMEAEQERREKRQRKWVRFHRANGSQIREKYQFFGPKELEWLMCAVINYHQEWKDITAKHREEFPDKTRTSHSLYSKWSRQWKKEENLRKRDPSLAPKRPGQDDIEPPSQRYISVEKEAMIAEATKLSRRQKKS